MHAMLVPAPHVSSRFVQLLLRAARLDWALTHELDGMLRHVPESEASEFAPFCGGRHKEATP